MSPATNRTEQKLLHLHLVSRTKLEEGAKLIKLIGWVEDAIQTGQISYYRVKKMKELCAESRIIIDKRFR